jgi:hypothetical protein
VNKALHQAVGYLQRPFAGNTRASSLGGRSSGLRRQLAVVVVLLEGRPGLRLRRAA